MVNWGGRVGKNVDELFCVGYGWGVEDGGGEELGVVGGDGVGDVGCGGGVDCWVVDYEFVGEVVG